MVTCDAPEETQSKQSRIEESIGYLVSAVNGLEMLSYELEEPVPSAESKGEGGGSCRPRLSLFLTRMPDDISELAGRIETATSSIRESCF